MATKKAPPAKKASPAKSVVGMGGVGMEMAHKKDEMRWRAEEDLRTIQRMNELKSDPSRIKMAEQMLKKQLQAVQAVKGK